MVRMIPLGSMKKTARTALVELSPGCIMPYFLGHFHGDVFDQRELDFNVLHPLVLDLFLDGAQPGDMAVEAVDREADQFAVHFAELVFHGGEGHELRGADRREVGRVAEEDDPAAGVLLGKVDLALGGHGLERRGLVADPGIDTLCVSLFVSIIVSFL